MSTDVTLLFFFKMHNAPCHMHAWCLSYACLMPVTQIVFHIVPCNHYWCHTVFLLRENAQCCLSHACLLPVTQIVFHIVPCNRCWCHTVFLLRENAQCCLSHACLLPVTCMPAVCHMHACCLSHGQCQTLVFLVVPCNRQMSHCFSSECTMLFVACMPFVCHMDNVQP